MSVIRRMLVAIKNAVSRSGLKRVFIGNTAERVLTALSCYVLVVKSLCFRARVPEKTHGMKLRIADDVLPLQA
jgi:hypothetical protein